MELLGCNLSKLGRESRVALLVAFLIALGSVCLNHGWLTVGLASVVAAAGIAGGFYLLVIRPSHIPPDAVLSLRMSGGIREDLPRTPLEQLRSRGAATLFDIRRALEAAASDSRLKSILVEICSPGFGLATAHELYELLRGAVAAGKRVVAILEGDQITPNDYLIACGASEVIANPDSTLMMLGFSTGSLFLSEALTKLGVQAQTLQWKEYKGAAEMFTRERMSPEVRESIEAVISDWQALMTQIIADSRRTSVQRARELLGGGFLSVRAACAHGLVDRAGYTDDIRNEIEPDYKSTSRFVPLGRYLRRLSYIRNGRARPQLALIHGLGPVVVGEGPMAGEFLSGERVSEEIRRAARDDRIKAIVFRVNSPGGSAAGSDLVWRAVREAQRSGKPLVVSMGDVAGSGGYYVASGADAIVAGPATLTGSIGVVYAKFNAAELMQRLGIRVEVVKSDSVSDALSLARPMTAAELAQLNEVVGELYSTFTAKVAEGRKLDPEATEQVARGRLWSGVAAKTRGLVDELGGLGRAVALAREKAGLKPGEEHDLVVYPPPSLLSALHLSTTYSEPPWPLAVAASALQLPERWTPALLRLFTRGGMLLLCPWFSR
jgi:protease-4